MRLADDPKAIVNIIGDRVATGGCILFLGAAVHSPPPQTSPYEYPPEDRPATAGELASLLAEKSGFCNRLPRDQAQDLQRVSLYYETMIGRQELVQEIRNAVQVGKRPSPVVRALARLPFPLVITTNYDLLFEDAVRSVPNKRPSVSVYESESQPPARYPNPYEPTPEEPFIFKIHGSVDRPESIVITDEDYIQFILRMGDPEKVHPIPWTFRYHLQTKPTLFLGYSLMDYNLRLLFKTLRWGADKVDIPKMYSVDRDPDPLIFEVWHNKRDYVTFVVQDVWTFVPELYRKIQNDEMPP